MRVDLSERSCIIFVYSIVVRERIPQLIRYCIYLACVLKWVTSLQGVGILVLHVIRSEKVLSKIGPRLPTLCEKLQSTFRSGKYKVVSYLFTWLLVKWVSEYNPGS